MIWVPVLETVMRTEIILKQLRAKTVLAYIGFGAGSTDPILYRFRNGYISVIHYTLATGLARLNHN